MGYAYYLNLCLISPESEATMDHLLPKLQQFYAADGDRIAFSRNGNSLKLKIDDYVFEIRHVEGAEILEESESAAKYYIGDSDTKSAIALCRARFEMYGDDDHNMDYFNDSLYIQECMEAVAKIYIFDPQGGKFMNLDL